MAQDLNSVVLVGRLGRDPELKTTQGGSTLCRAGIAVNGSVKKGDKWEDETHWFNVTVFGGQAEALAKYARKGHRIAVSGRLRQRTWKAEDGTRREEISVAANSVQFLQEKSKTEAPDTTAPADDGVPF